MAHNWQKWKRVFLTCPCHGICRDEAVGLRSLKIYFKNYDLCEYVEFGAISWFAKIWKNLIFFYFWFDLCEYVEFGAISWFAKIWKKLIFCQ